jgi:hypothetical protein
VGCGRLLGSYPRLLAESGLFSGLFEPLETGAILGLSEGRFGVCFGTCFLVPVCG